MISKDPNFLNNRLSQLKKSVLNKNTEDIRPNQTPHRITFQSKQDNEISNSGRKIIRYSIGDRKKNNDYTEELHRDYTKERAFPSQNNNYTEYSRQTNTVKAHNPHKMFSTVVKDNRMENDFQPSRVDYKTTYLPQKSAYQSNLDGPRVVRVNNSNLGSFKGRLENEPSKKPNYKFQMPQSNILDSLNKNAFMDKYKLNMADDLNGRMQECQEVNRRLEEEIANLKKALDSEKRKTEDVAKMCQEELIEAKGREEDSIKGIKNIEREKNEQVQHIRHQDEHNYKVT